MCCSSNKNMLEGSLLIDMMTACEQLAEKKPSKSYLCCLIVEAYLHHKVLGDDISVLDRMLLSLRYSEFLVSFKVKSECDSIRISDEFDEEDYISFQKVLQEQMLGILGFEFVDIYSELRYLGLN